MAPPRAARSSGSPRHPGDGAPRRGTGWCPELGGEMRESVGDRWSEPPAGDGPHAAPQRRALDGPDLGRVERALRVGAEDEVEALRHHPLEPIDVEPQHLLAL